jgi:hypothetical protein
MSQLAKLKTRLNQVADLNGDGKVDKADVSAAVACLESEAGELVSKKGALGACLTCGAVCLVVGVVLAAMLKIGC